MDLDVFGACQTRQVYESKSPQRPSIGPWALYLAPYFALGSLFGPGGIHTAISLAPTGPRYETVGYNAQCQMLMLKCHEPGAATLAVAT